MNTIQKIEDERCPTCGKLLRRSHNINCPYCNSNHVISIGFSNQYRNKNYKGKRRYLCKDCKRTFYNDKGEVF